MLITSTANPRIKELRKLHKRKVRHQRGQLLIEGVRLVQDALASGMQPELVVYAPDLLRHPDGHALVDIVQAQGVELLACTPAVFASLAETVTPQGIVALLPIPTPPRPPTPDLVLLLDGIRDPGNAGTLLRSAEAAGCDLVLCGPGVVDPYNDKTLRAGMGAHFRLPIESTATWHELLARIPAELAWYVADAGGHVSYTDVDWTEPVMVIVGSEATGPGPEIQTRAQSLAIPMHGQVESLNAAMAGTIILFEAARQRRAAAQMMVPAPATTR